MNEENESPVRWFEDQQAMKREREVVQRRKQSKAQCTLQLRRRRSRVEENNKSRGGVEQRRAGNRTVPAKHKHTTASLDPSNQDLMIQIKIIKKNWFEDPRIVSQSPFMISILFFSAICRLNET